MIKTYVLFMVFGFVVGVVCCAAVYATFLCPDTSKAVVKQIQKDNRVAVQLEVKAKAQKVKDATFNQAVDVLPDGTGCSTVPNDALYNLLLDSQFD